MKARKSTISDKFRYGIRDYEDITKIFKMGNGLRIMLAKRVKASQD